MNYLDVLQAFGWPIGSLLIVVMMLYTDKIVSGRRYRDMQRQRDRLLKLALGGQRKAWQAADLADALVPSRAEGGDDADAH